MTPGSRKISPRLPFNKCAVVASILSPKSISTSTPQTGQTGPSVGGKRCPGTRPPPPPKNLCRDLRNRKRKGRHLNYSTATLTEYVEDGRPVVAAVVDIGAMAKAVRVQLTAGRKDQDNASTDTCGDVRREENSQERMITTTIPPSKQQATWMLQLLTHLGNTGEVHIAYNITSMIPC